MSHSSRPRRTVSSPAGVPPCTLILVVDRPHLEELRWAWSSWVMHQPYVSTLPTLVAYDASSVDPVRPEELEFIRSPLETFGGSVEFVPILPSFCPAAAGQRERMLSAFVLLLPQLVRTPYYLKLDTDLVAVAEGRTFPNAEWFEGGPAIIAPRWSYTKPADRIAALDRWGDAKLGIKEKPPLNLPYDPAAKRIRHSRIISYCMFGRTDWTCDMAAIAGDRLPVPSQDSFLWYCAARRGERINSFHAGHFGWKHCGSRLSRVRDAARDATRGQG